MYARPRRRRRARRGSRRAVALRRRASTGDGGRRRRRRAWAEHARPRAAARVARRDAGPLTLGPPRPAAGLPPSRLHSTLVIAPTQTGKTTGLAIPRSSSGTARCSRRASRPTCCATRSTRARELGDASSCSTPPAARARPSSSWTPLAGCYDVGRRAPDGRWLTEGAVAQQARTWPTRTSGTRRQPSSSHRCCSPPRVAGRTMADVVTWIDTQDDSAVLDVLDMPNDAELRTACHRAERRCGRVPGDVTRDERQRSSIYTTAETVLEAYADPGVLAHSESCRDLAGRPPRRRQRHPLPQRDGPGAAAAAAGVRRADRGGDRGGVRPRRATGRSHSTRRCSSSSTRPRTSRRSPTSTSSPRPAPDTACSWSPCCRTSRKRTTGGAASAPTRSSTTTAPSSSAAGTADSRTLDYAARLLGDADYRQQSSSVTSGRRTETEGSVYRPLAPPHAIRQGRAHSALLIYGNLPPAWIGLRPWFAERELSALARGEAATGRE